MGEAAGYAIGLIKVSRPDETFTENMVNASRNNQHERIARCTIMGLAMSYLENQQKSFEIYEKLIEEKDTVLRTGAVRILALGFVNSSSNKVIRILLDRIAKDLSDEVKK